MPQRPLFSSLILVILVVCSSAFADVFDLDEIQVAPSPAEVKILDFKEPDKILDLDVARSGPRAAVLVQSSAAASARVVFWDIGASPGTTEWAVPAQYGFHSLAWHPQGKSFFLAGSHGSEYVIARVDKHADSWSLKVIYQTRQEIRRLVPGPRPYIVHAEPGQKEDSKSYRLFFGVKGQDGAYAIRSVTEQGKRDYQVIGSKKGFTTFKDEGTQPSRLQAPSALPLAFHPAGHILLWEDEKHCFHQAIYERDHWEEEIELELCGGTVTPTPNGLALIQWQPGSSGVTIISRHGEQKSPQASEYSFSSTPSSVPDGKGIVGTLKKDDRFSLVYVPIQVPLADVANAWMFAESGEDEDLLERKGGLLRDLPYDQLYSLYESEAYQCGQYDSTTPTRPYFLTTDIFWELLAAAYQGLFIVSERQQAIPAFWEFVGEADRYFSQASPGSRWASVFSVITAMRKPSVRKGREKADPGGIQGELALIRKAQGKAESPLLGATVDYGELKPRGHYSSSAEMSVYFMAFKYLTQLAGGALLPEEDAPASEERLSHLEALKKLPSEARTKAQSWIGAYEVFTPPSRSPQVLRDERLSPPSYARHPLNQPRIFPLAWGFDNEALLSTVYHPNWPEAEQIKGPSGARLVPSGLDVAAALGSRFAAGLLSEEMEKYPPLKTAIEDLRSRYRTSKATAQAPASLYDRWIDALALQWADDVAPPDSSRGRELWDVRRLQTGLASWATLRHATVLVNERSDAECGEGAFEPILLSPPRGYVEPDPDTFHALAGLFRSMSDMVKSWKTSKEETIQVGDFDDNREALKAGISRRLEQTAEKAELFEKMARKEIAGEPLSGQEYEEILYVGRVAEHHFLIFKSLAAKDYALSEPDPMPKITDVAGGGPSSIPFLMVAVGRPMEWNQIVPYFGRKELVKGAVYSYYEFESEGLMNDEEWLDKLPEHSHPHWASPFVSESAASCPPGNPY